MSNSSYPDNWDQIRRAIYSRDSYTCQRCGATDVELHAHHKIPISQGGGHQFGNLVTLCKSCHETHHGHPIGGNQSVEDYRFEGILGIVLGASLTLAVPAFAPFGFVLILGGIVLLFSDG